MLFWGWAGRWNWADLSRRYVLGMGWEGMALGGRFGGKGDFVHCLFEEVLRHSSVKKYHLCHVTPLF